MKTALVLALLGACVAVSYGCYGDYEYKCVKDDYKKCKAIKVCEDYKKEKCGYDYCDYGYVCASKKKAVCKDFIKLKKKCEKKKVCKEVKKECGYDHCHYDEECVKEKICEVKYGYGRRLMRHVDGHAEAHAEAHAHASAKKYGDYYYEPCEYCKKKEKLECYDAYKCVKKEPCKEVVLKKCVKDKYRPGYDVCHGGHEFYWDDGYSYGDECGDEYCGHGYKCAYVYYQKCDAYKCGHDYCDYGYECVAEDDDCKKYAYLETICKDVYEPTCVALGYYALSYYYPKCKTVYKCDEYENICGGEYCGYGYTCALKECKDDYYGEDPYHKDDYYYKDPEHKGDYYYKDPEHKGDHYYKEPEKKHDDYYPDDHKHGPDHKHEGGSASSYSSSYAGPDGAYTDGESITHGDATARSRGSAYTDGAYAKHRTSASGRHGKKRSNVKTKAYSDGYKTAGADGYAGAYDNKHKHDHY